MSINLINHQGQQIVFVDYRSCKTKEEMIAKLKDAEDVIKKTPGKVHSLSDFTGTHGSPEFMAEIKRAGRETFDIKTDKVATIGITGIKKVLLNGYNLVVKKKVPAFDTKEKAMEYLTSGT